MGTAGWYPGYGASLSNLVRLEPSRQGGTCGSSQGTSAVKGGRSVKDFAVEDAPQRDYPLWGVFLHQC
jgi:hypothetical protein